MLRTKVMSSTGLVLTLTSLLLGAQRLGYQRAVVIMQAGGLALVLGLFFRLWGDNKAGDRSAMDGSLASLYDLEAGPANNS